MGEALSYLFTPTPFEISDLNKGSIKQRLLVITTSSLFIEME
jgi:hypothetical protein